MERRGKKRFIFIAVAFAFTLVLNLAGALADTESDFLNLINKERATVGKGKLALNGDLTEAAYLHAKGMAENNYFSHTSKDGRTFVTRIKNAGYTGYYALGENIAYHYGTANASKVFGMWKGSSGHYSNMISSNFNEMGLGAYSKNGYTYYVLDLGGRKIAASNYTNTTVPPTNLNSTNSSVIVNSTTNNTNNPLIITINVTKTSSSYYYYYKIIGKVSNKSRLSYVYNGITRTICYSCTSFTQYFRVSRSSGTNAQILYTAKDSLGFEVNRTVILN